MALNHYVYIFRAKDIEHHQNRAEPIQCFLLLSALNI